jgi:dTDP-4-amino-4,6-dideoxygalactose transaminase
MNLPLVDLDAQQKELAPELLSILTSRLERTDWILGDELDAFESEFAEYCEARHAIGLDSGMSALELALRAFGVGPGDEVITAANSFIATALAISHAGARPVLVDIDPETYNMSPALLERAITKRTKAVIPVHLYGQPADMAGIQAIAEEYGLLIIEDACQAHGARFEGIRTGSLGHAGAFSFYPAKNLGAFGDGGALVTDDDEVANSVRILRDYGQRTKYEHVEKGFNRRLDTLQAAILRIKLRRLDEWNRRRQTHAGLYSQLLADAEVITPRVGARSEPVWHLYVIRVAARDQLRASLSARGIATGIHYPIPIHQQPAYRDLRYPTGSFPVTERYADQILSLPMYPELDGLRIAHVAGTIHQTASALDESFRSKPAGAGEAAGAHPRVGARSHKTTCR